MLHKGLSYWGDPRRLLSQARLRCPRCHQERGCQRRPWRKALWRQRSPAGAGSGAAVTALVTGVFCPFSLNVIGDRPQFILFSSPLPSLSCCSLLDFLYISGVGKHPLWPVRPVTPRGPSAGGWCGPGCGFRAARKAPGASPPPSLRVPDGDVPVTCSSPLFGLFHRRARPAPPATGSPLLVSALLPGTGFLRPEKPPSHFSSCASTRNTLI